MIYNDSSIPVLLAVSNHTALPCMDPSNPSFFLDTAIQRVASRIFGNSEAFTPFNETCHTLLAKETFSCDEVEALFAIEQEIREYRDNHAGSTHLRQVYTSTLLPVYHKVKTFLTKRPLSHSVKLAASQGQALQAGLAGLEQLTAPLQVIRFDEKSANQLWLMKDVVVYKKSNRRAKEETRLIIPLFHLRSPLSTVPSFTMQQLARSCYGMTMKREHYLRGYADTPLLDPTLKTSLYHTLSEQERKVETAFAKRYCVAPFPDLQKMDWAYLKEGEWHTASLSQLRRLYEQDKLAVDCLIMQQGQCPLRLDEHLFTETALSKALKTQQRLPELFFIPDLSNPEKKTVYEACEKVEWSFKNARMQTQKVSFQTVQTLFLCQGTLTDLTVDPQAPLTEEERNFLNLNVNQALSIGWKIAVPEAFQEKATRPDLSYHSIKEIEAKPFIQEMKTIRQLLNNKELLNGIVSRLDEKSLWNIIATAELQFLDLHSDNVGMAPQQGHEEAYHSFKNKRFRLSPSSIKTVEDFYSGPALSFEALYEQSLRGLLSNTTWVTFLEEKTPHTPLSCQLDQHKELQALLNRPWQLIFYDLDLNLSEDNELQEQSKRVKNKTDSQSTEPSNQNIPPQYQREHLIPFRSAFLELDLKDYPISEQLLQRLENSASSDQEIRQWCLKSDSPIRQRMRDPYRKELNDKLKPFLEKSYYTLSHYRRKNCNATIKDIQSDFVEDFINLHPPDNHLFWCWMEEALSHGRVLNGDTWDSLAVRYKQSAAKLQELNEGKNPPKPAIRLHVSLCGDDPKSQEKRRKIASQLFPRITWKQYEALVSRQERRNAYLQGYRTLKESQSYQSMIETIDLFLGSGIAPLTTTKKAFYFDSIKKLSPFNPTEWSDPHFSDLIKLKNALLAECLPTYFNLMKAMYPLLADAYQLNCYLSSSEASAGSKIGWSDFSLEKHIQIAKQHFPLKHKAYQLALLIEKKIAAKTHPAYFGKWQ